MENIKLIRLGKANCSVDLGDGSERGEYVSQDYILSRALERTVVVEPSVKVEKALRKRLEALCDELSRIEDAGQMTQELQEELATVLSVCRRLGEEKPPVRDDDPLLNYKRIGARNRNISRAKEE